MNTTVTYFIIIPLAMVRKLGRDLQQPFLWFVVCISLTLVYLLVVSLTFHVDILTPKLEMYPLDIDEGDSYSEAAGDVGVQMLLRYRDMYVPHIFYNRVPKCGSETVRFLMLRLAWFNDFQWITSRVFLNYTLDTEQQHTFVEYFKNIQPPAIYERHAHFIDFRRFGADQPLYTSLVREPVDRLVSWYYFIRFQEGHIRSMEDWRRNMTYDDCVQEEHAECTSEMNYFRIIPFFCGQEYECRTQTPWSLARAKRHLDEHYISVGVAEDIRNYFFVMEYLLPSYFKDAVNMYDVVAEDLKEWTKTKKKRPISTKTRSIMRENLRFEYEFYYFAKQRFYRLLYLVESEKAHLEP